jgi:2-(1,2-epoxy-1,2-dihydrophenyl)acetyl-CoA isomerase
MEAQAAVLCDVDGGVATITLNRPRALNAWTPDMGRELLATLRRAGGDSEVRAVLVTGAGRAFCAGADVTVPRDRRPDGTPDLSNRLREIYNPLLLALREMPKPAIAAVNGVAAGLGASLALACDLIIAGRSAYFLLAFVRLGLSPDGGAAHHLLQRAGRVRAAELAMLGERLGAEQALQWGVVNRVVDDGELPGAAGELATRLAAGPTVALAGIKRVLDGPDGTRELAAQLEHEAALQQAHALTADYAEGVRAFSEKREPRFTGRGSGSPPDLPPSGGLGRLAGEAGPCAGTREGTGLD